MYKTASTGQFHHAFSTFELRRDAYVRIKSDGRFGIVLRSRPLGANRFMNLVRTCEAVPELHPVYEFLQSQTLTQGPG